MPLDAMPFDAVLCDLDGVLRIWDPAAMPDLDRAHGLPAGTLARAAFRPERLTAAVTGTVTDEEWRAAVAGDLAAVCGGPAKARALVGAWTARPGRVDREMAALLARVRRRVPVILVSNATTRLEADLAALGLSPGGPAAAFDAVVNTARVGWAKPDPRVYRIAAERAGAEPARCLFVDDTEGNVAAARALGMTGHHYRSRAQLEAVLAPLVQMAAIRHDDPELHSEEG
ncbi:HAD family hydrolase [Streptomyces litchfieldiae]|uniref:HAD-IA family hydrolase n=1 Tax=Streptomyces litchfieldiae TaxID=3075543 RepID=A0ABU2MMJ4_9ACTN|nr:HAD-IA family hydrolase [Streptomyces sp. DSM 44938]MDT0341874.1 HAD-IA family hydrolase [Streptomyces sp. DSM 44938]